MAVSKRILDFYIQSSLHVTFCYVAFYTVVSLQLGFQPSLVEWIAVGCSTLVGYNLAKYVHLYRSNFQFKNGIILLTAVSTVIGLVLVWLLGIYAVVLFSFCGLLTLFYSLPQLLGKSFRQIPILKLVIIGISWSLLAIMLPNLIVDNYFSPKSILHFRANPNYDVVFWEFIKYVLFVIALCIPFEIRDLKYDAPELRTLPQMIGVSNTKYVGLALLFACGFLEYYQLDNNDNQSMIWMLVLALTAIAIWFASHFKSDYYASLFVEAIPLMWLGIYWIGIN